LSSRVPSSIPPKNILVATDGSENAKRAEEVAIKLAKEYGAELTMLDVVTELVYFLSPPPAGVAPAFDQKDLFGTFEKGARKLVDQSVQRAKAQGVKARGEVLHSTESVVYEITHYAKDKDVDLIVIGTRGLGGFKRLLLGSVSSGVVTHAHCNVLVVK
jgi:nucleotide-binding universal stress UspA family protein